MTEARAFSRNKQSMMSLAALEAQPDETPKSRKSYRSARSKTVMRPTAKAYTYGSQDKFRSGVASIAEEGQNNRSDKNIIRTPADSPLHNRNRSSNIKKTPLQFDRNSASSTERKQDTKNIA
uniref:Uncharacterized protein n=1 Tax=Amorphochlora amoebiformis TaxID=1561963 RepID=A0A7S0H4P8_9EUKA